MVLVNVVKIDRQITENLNGTDMPCHAMSIPFIHLKREKINETVLIETENSTFFIDRKSSGRKFDEYSDITLI